MDMNDLIDLAAFPLHRPDTEPYAALVARCRSDLDRQGMCNLDGFLFPSVAERTARTLAPAMRTDGFRHSRRHNVYFRREVDGLSPDHPALQEFDTCNLTLCADQIGATPIPSVYDWPPLRRFLAAIMGKDRLYTMADPLARINVMSYGAGDALGWHFDRSEFTTTLLLQAPSGGGAFEYRNGLRTGDDPNYEGVARLLRGADPEVRQMSLSAGTLNVFRGIDTPHRVTPVEGDIPRMIAVFSYFDRPGVVFTPAERIGFYGRSA